jgi:hypothetical protein
MILELGSKFLAQSILHLSNHKKIVSSSGADSKRKEEEEAILAFLLVQLDCTLIYGV